MNNNFDEFFNNNDNNTNVDNNSSFNGFDNTNINNNNISSNNYTNKLLIPFNKSLDDAYKDYKKKVIINPLIPLIFKKKSTVKSIKKCYLATYLSNVNISGDVSYLALDVNKSIDKKNTYEKQKYNVSTTSNFDYINLLEGAYSKIDNEILSYISDFDFNKVINSNSDFNDITFLPEDTEINGISSKLQNNIMNHSIGIIRDSIQHDKKKLNQNNLVVNCNSNNKLYVPVYFVNIQYNNKDYIYLMNGDTGKSYINLPISKISIGIFSLIIFLIIFGIVYLIAYLF
jgi:hypothetical protein